MKIFIFSIAGFIPFTLLGLFLSNPHGPIGGYISIFGKIMILPIFLYRDNVGYFKGVNDWILSMGMQFLYFFGIVGLIRFLLKIYQNKKYNKDS